MAEQTSYRQVGKEFPGRLFKGRLPEPVGCDQSVGFGAKTGRFPTPQSPSSAVLRSVTPLPTHTPLGCMSKSKRFNPRQYLSSTPGPGTYDCKLAQSTRLIKTPFISKESRSVSPVMSSPAPGQYNPVEVAGKKSVSSVFRSAVKRIALQPPSFGPPPGAYSPKYTVISHTTAITSAFKQPVNKRRMQINLFNPLSKVIKRHTSPGPGAYEVTPSTRQAFVDLPSAVFLSSENRFPTPRVDETGRRWEDGGEKWGGKEKGSMAAFKSDTQRGDFVAKQLPGPAFYKPSVLPKHQSFHLNLAKRWVA